MTVSASGVTPHDTRRRATGSVTLLICGRACIPSIAGPGYRAGRRRMALVKNGLRVEAAVVRRVQVGEQRNREAVVLADKNTAGAAVGRAPTADEPARIRNVVLVGHSG